MSFAGFGNSHIPYDMFELSRSADEAKRLSKCERIYHRGQVVAWDGREILSTLIAEHGGVHIAPTKRAALERIFTIIMWGELAAWKISAQLADQLVPLEAKMAATSQAFDEARHFYVMHDYLTALGYTPGRLDRAPRAVLDLVIGTRSLAHKLLGMQLMIETIALTIFQTVRELDVEPVLTELMKYYERDEARHVGLGMQYLPNLMAGMTRRELGALLTFQCRVVFWTLWETKVIESDLRSLGIEPRRVLERARQKQLVALEAAYSALGLDFDRQRNVAVDAINAAVEVLFPDDAARGSAGEKLRAAWRAFRGRTTPLVDRDALAVHAAHAIRTARGQVAPAAAPEA